MAAAVGVAWGNDSMMECMRYGVNQKTHEEGTRPVLGAVKLQGMSPSPCTGGNTSTLTCTESSFWFKHNRLKVRLKGGALGELQGGASLDRLAGSAEAAGLKHHYAQHCTIRVGNPQADPALLKAIQNPSQWPEVVKLWGTAYRRQGWLGGELFCQALSQHARSSRRVQAGLGGGVPSATASAGFELSWDRASGTQATSSSEVLCFNGGDPELLRQGFADWAKSTEKSPVIVREKLVSLAELLPAGPPRTAFQKFLDEYLLEEVQSRVPKLRTADLLLLAQTDGLPEGTLREAPVLQEEGADAPVRWVGVQYRVMGGKRTEITDVRFGRAGTAVDLFSSGGSSTEQEVWEVPLGDHITQFRCYRRAQDGKTRLAGIGLYTRCGKDKLFGVRQSEPLVQDAGPNEAIIDAGVWRTNGWLQALTGVPSVTGVKLVLRNQYGDEEPLGIGAEKLDFAAKLRAADDFYGREWLQKACTEAVLAYKSRGVELTGPPGSGKTAMLAKLLRDWKRVPGRVHVLGYHMCNGADVATLSAPRLVHNMMRQAVRVLRGVATKETCAEVLAEATPSACMEDPVKVFQAGFGRLLKEAGRPDDGVYVLMVDGLDEAWSEGGLQILEVLRAAAELPDFCRVVVSVRTGHPACGKLGLTNIGIAGIANTKDIRGYVKSRLSGLLTENRTALVEPRFSQVVEQLTKDSRGIIAYACFKLDDAISPTDSVIDLRKLETGLAAPGLSGLFREYLQRRQPHSPLAAALLAAAVASPQPLTQTELLLVTVAVLTADGHIDKASIQSAEEAVAGFLARWSPLYPRLGTDTFDFFHDSFRLFMEEEGLRLVCDATREKGHAWLAEAALLCGRLADPPRPDHSDLVQKLKAPANLLEQFRGNLRGSGAAKIWPSKVFDAPVGRIGDPAYSTSGIQPELPHFLEQYELLNDAFVRGGLKDLLFYLNDLFVKTVIEVIDKLRCSSLPSARILANAYALRAKMDKVHVAVPKAVGDFAAEVLSKHLTSVLEQVEGLFNAFKYSPSYKGAALVMHPIAEKDLRSFFMLVAPDNDFLVVDHREAVWNAAKKFLEARHVEADSKLAKLASSRKLVPNLPDFARALDSTLAEVTKSAHLSSRLSGA